MNHKDKKNTKGRKLSDFLRDDKPYYHENDNH
jgi:hypothetical protein